MKNTSAALTVSKAALILGGLSVVSRLAGIVRDRLLAHSFGASSTLDAYYAAFRLPDLIFQTMVLGALASAFIPVFVRLRQQDEVVAQRLGQTLLTGIGSGLTIMAALGVWLAPELVALYTPGFDAERMSLAVSLTRIMLVATVVFGISNVVSSVLQAQQRFVAFGLAPVVYNCGIIAGVYLLVPYLGTQGLAWGVVLGSLLHLVVQLPSAWRSGFRLRLCWKFGDPAVRQVARLMAPRTIGLAASQLNQLVTAGFVSHLTVGSLAAFTLATNLQSFPISVVGVSLAVAAFPIFSESLGNGSPDTFAVHFRSSMRRILFFVLPLAVLFLVLRAQIVRVVLGSGAFDWGDTIRTAQVLGFLALALVSDSLVPLVARAFYALQDTRTPVRVALISIAVNIAALLLFRSAGLAGVGIAYALSSLCNLCLLLVLLERRLPRLDAHEILLGLRPMLAASVLSGAAAYATLQLVAPLVDMRSFLGILLQGGAAGLVGVSCYLTLVLFWRVDEVAFVRSWLSSALRTSRRLMASP